MVECGMLLFQLKVFKQYERDRKPVDLLSDEDKFIMQVCGRLLADWDFHDHDFKSEGPV